MYSNLRLYILFLSRFFGTPLMGSGVDDKYGIDQVSSTEPELIQTWTQLALSAKNGGPFSGLLQCSLNSHQCHSILFAISVWWQGVNLLIPCSHIWTDLLMVWRPHFQTQFCRIWPRQSLQGLPISVTIKLKMYFYKVKQMMSRDLASRIFFFCNQPPKWLALSLPGSLWLTLQLYLAPAGSLWLSLALSGSLWLTLALSGSLWLSQAHSGSLWLSQALSGSLLLSEFAYKALAWLTRPLLGSQRRCNTLISPVSGQKELPEIHVCQNHHIF